MWAPEEHAPSWRETCITQLTVEMTQRQPSNVLEALIEGHMRQMPLDVVRPSAAEQLPLGYPGLDRGIVEHLHGDGRGHRECHGPLCT